MSMSEDYDCVGDSSDIYCSSSLEDLKNIKFCHRLIMQHLKKDYGALTWHISKNSSIYIKFKDVRLGSIRIANHTGRSKYMYTYDIDVTNCTNLFKECISIIGSVKYKATTIHKFNSKVYVVYDKNNGYIELPSFIEYKEFILKRNKK